MERVYVAIDLKSFYASVECAERGLDPLSTCLVVADPDRTEKTICLAVSPPLKALGIPGRPRLFEVVQKVQAINAQRQMQAPGKKLTGTSWDANTYTKDPSLGIEYIVAMPRMAYYMTYSARIYSVYLRYIAPEDIHVYSIDEVFIDVTAYLATYKMTARELAMKLIREVLTETGITATAGIGTNLYLAKIAMDIVAKHIPADENGVRIAELDEMSYRQQLWQHRPLRDFWRIGGGYVKRLEDHGLFTMGDIARCSITHEDLLYKLFGVNAELLIDHAWGWEPCTIADIKAYKPKDNSVSSGQVLPGPYKTDRARIVVQEMADALALSLVDKKVTTDRVSLMIGYDVENLQDPVKRMQYTREVTIDRYGRQTPKQSHGSAALPQRTNSSRMIIKSILSIFDQIADPALTIRRLTLSAGVLKPDTGIEAPVIPEQLDLFTDYAQLEKQHAKEQEELQKEKHLQEAVLQMKKKFGKNMLLRGVSLEEDATQRKRNAEIGGHKA